MKNGKCKAKPVVFKESNEGYKHLFPTF